MHTTRKDKDIKIRIAGNLKERYIAALNEEGLSATDHLTNVIYDFVTTVEKRNSKKQTQKK